MTSLPFRIGALAAILAAAAPVAAQQPQARVLPVSADAPFAHANSGLTLPTRLAGLPRTQVREFEAPELDVVGTYADDGRELTVYVYRSLAGAVPVWFDRATWAIESRDGWGKLTPIAAAPVTIAPPGRSVASGLAQAWSVEGGPYRATSVALLPLGDWLVKLRYSSKTEDGAQAMAQVRAALAAMAWPAAAKDGPAAAVVTACPQPLRFDGSAKVMKADQASVMMSALMAGAIADPELRAKATPAASWCRDPVAVQMGAVYRADASTTSYLLALSDAGRGVSVNPSMASQIDKTAKPGWGVDLILPGRTMNYPQFDRLPAPQQVLAALSGPPTSSVTTWGPKRQVNLPSDLFKSRK